MTKHDRTEERIDALRRIAVSAVMRFGQFECSGATRLVVFRLKDVMIAYRTPFNPVPPLGEQAKFIAAREGRTARLLPYGIDVWQRDVGKVMSLGWRDGETAVVDLYSSGDWERLLETCGIGSAHRAKCGKTAKSPTAAGAPGKTRIGPQAKTRGRMRAR